MNERTVRIQLVLLFCVALAARFVFIYQQKDTPFARNLIIDADKYSQDGAAIAQGLDTEFTKRPFWQAPGYTVMLALMYKLFGIRNYLAVRLFQAFLSSCLVLMTFAIGRRLGLAYRVSFAGACILAVYAPEIFFVGELAIPVPLMFLTYLSFLLLLVESRLLTFRRLFVAGALLGLAALFRPVVFVLGLPVCLWFYSLDKNPQNWLKWSIVFIAGVVLIVAPVTIRNWRLGGEFILVSHNGGINLWIGNNPDWKRTFNIRPGPAWEKMIREPVSREGGRVASPARSSGYWMRKVASYAWRRPAMFIRGILDKTLLFLNSRELRRNTDIVFCMYYIPLMCSPLLPGFGILGPLAVLGMIYSAKRGRLWFAVCVVVVYAFANIAFFVCGRYRLPVIPLLALFAAIGLEELYSKRFAPRTLIPRLMVLFFAAVLVNGDFVPGIDRSHGESVMYLGRFAAKSGRHDVTEACLKRAVELSPSSVEAREAFGLYLMGKGRYDEAKEQFEAIIGLDPWNYLYRKNLGALYLQLQEYDKAEREFRIILGKDPGNAEALEGLAAVEMGRGNYARAEYFFSESSRTGPKDIWVTRLNRARALILQQKNIEAIKVLLEILKARPTMYEARYDLAHLYIEAGMYADAIYQLGMLRPKRRSEEAERSYTIGMCYYYSGNDRQALEWFRKALKAGYQLPDAVRRRYGRALKEEPMPSPENSG